MSNTDPTGFGKFVPGFDFLQNLSKGAAASMPALNQWNQWVAPTLDAKALDKRIEELKAVQFWLDQNATALKATIQALEVQKMTLATLKGMNFNPPDLAQAFKATTATPASPAAPSRAAPRKPRAKAASAAPSTAAQPDPMQFWNALTQQFQHIAARAMQDVKGQAAAVGKTAAPTATAPKTGAARKTVPRRR